MGSQKVVEETEWIPEGSCSTMEMAMRVPRRPKEAQKDSVDSMGSIVALMKLLES